MFSRDRHSSQDGQSTDSNLGMPLGDDNLLIAMSLLNEALTKWITSTRMFKQPTLQESLAVILSNWSTFFPLPKSTKYKRVFQRAQIIKPQNSPGEKGSFDIDRHQHDLECLARIAASIKCSDVEEKIRNMQPFILVSSFRHLSVQPNGKEPWVLLKDEAKELMTKADWQGAIECYR